MVTRSPAGALAKAGSLAAGVAAAFLLTGYEVSAESPAAMTAWTEVVVRVYDTSGLSRTSRQRALAEARAAMVAASVEIAWIDCAEQGGACQTPPAPRELIVRLVNGRTASGGQRLPLGDALIDAGGHRGVLATVYVDRVRRLAATVGTDEALLLGRAMAHELGHVLTGSAMHARGGLMRGTWTSEELRRDRREDWVFCTDSVARLTLAGGKWEGRSAK